MLIKLLGYNTYIYYLFFIKLFMSKFEFKSSGIERSHKKKKETSLLVIKVILVIII